MRPLNEESIFPSRFRFCLWHKWRKCAFDCANIHYDSLAGIVRYLHADARVCACACACACVEYFSNAAVGIPRVLYNCCIYLVKPFQINASWRGRYRRRARPFHISVKSISKSIPSECPSLIYDLNLHNNAPYYRRFFKGSVYAPGAFPALSCPFRAGQLTANARAGRTSLFGVSESSCARRGGCALAGQDLWVAGRVPRYTPFTLKPSGKRLTPPREEEAQARSLNDRRILSRSGRRYRPY